MKRIFLAILVGVALMGSSYAALVFLQRPTPSVVGGATSGGTASSLLVDSDGTLHTTSIAPTTTTDVNVKQVNGATVVTGTGTSVNAERVVLANEPVVAIVPGSSGLYDYAGTGSTITTLSATSGTSWTTGTLYINSLHCFNQTAGAVTVSRTDTANNKFETAKSIAANADSYLETPGSWSQMVGVKIWAGTSSAITCLVVAKN